MRCKSLRGRCKSSSLQTVSPNTLAISRTSSNARRSSPAGICARKPFRLVEHNTADSGDGTVYEHNYSRMNEGGCVMFCLEEAIHNTFRGNVSYDDLGGTISPSQNPDALLEHNTFYLRDGVPFVRARMDGGSYTEKDDTILPLPKKAQKQPPPRMSNLSASGADFCIGAGAFGFSVCLPARRRPMWRLVSACQVRCSIRLKCLSQFILLTYTQKHIMDPG